MNGSKLSQNAMKQSDNISFKSIMSQALEGSIDQQTEDEEGDFSFQQQSEDGGLIAQTGSIWCWSPDDGHFEQQRESGNARNTHRKIGSQSVLRRPCDVVGCEVLCEKSRSLVGAVEQCCRMHKREDSFKLKGVEGVFRWCFYCHKSQNIEDFSSVSKSICTEKFLLRKQRRKLVKNKLLLTEASKAQMETERYVTMEHHQQQPFARKQEKKAKAKSSSGGSKKKRNK